MSQHIALIIIVGYLAVLLSLGLFASRLFRGTSRDYLLASHSIGPFLLLMSLFGTTMTAFALIGSTGESFRGGVGVYAKMASSSGIIHSLCFFVVGIKLWSLGQKHGYVTQIQFFRDRLESGGIGLLLFPVLVGLIIPYLLIGVLGSGAVINGVTRGTFPEHIFADYNHGVPNWLASLVVCIVVMLYVFLGGMRGTAWANALQTIVFMVLGVVAFFVIAKQLGGRESLIENLRAASQAVEKDLMTRTDISKLVFLTYMLIPFSVGMFPHLFQHWLTAKSAESFKLPVVAHPIFIMLVWAPCVMIGVWATIEAAGIPPTVPPNAVLPFLVKKLAGPVLAGCLTAGILAAIMSSLDSQFLCVGSMFTNDLVLHYGGHDRFSDRQTIWLARLFVVLVVAVTYTISLFAKQGVFWLGIWCFTGFASLFPLVLAALYWRRLTAAGAYASVITMVGSWIYFFVQSGYGENAEYRVAGMMPVAPIMAAAAVALVLVSLVTRPPSAATLAKFFPVTPSGHLS
jgi:SSS family solute:Na+ symporter